MLLLFHFFTAFLLFIRQSRDCGRFCIGETRQFMCTTTEMLWNTAALKGLAACHIANGTF